MILSCHDSVAQRPLPVAPLLRISLRLMRLMGHAAHFCRHVYHARSQEEKHPFRRAGRGVEELTDDLKIVNNVQSESDNILLANRETASRHVVRSITGQAVVPAHLGTSDHIFPEGIIDCTRQSEQLA